MELLNPEVFKMKTFIDSSVIGYMSADIAKTELLAYRQYQTRVFWKKMFTRYQPYFSEYIFEEAIRGGERHVLNRIQYLENFNYIEISQNIIDLANKLIDNKLLPKSEFYDAAHIAAATIYNLDIIVSWNFKHIVHPNMRYKIRKYIEDNNFRCPVIATPEELNESLGGIDIWKTQ